MGHPRREVLGALGAASAAGFAGCTQQLNRHAEPTPVRIGSKLFLEQQLLGSLAYERLRGVDGLDPIDRTGYGGSEENWAAVTSGATDCYWEYTGTMWTTHPPERDERVTDPERLYRLVVQDAAEHPVEVGSMAGFSNEWVVFARSDWADERGITTISDLAALLLEEGGNVRATFGQHFYAREDAWLGLAAQYGIDGDLAHEWVETNVVVTTVGLTYDLVLDERAAVGTGFRTDPELHDDRLVVLEDDRDYFLPYHPFPVVNAETAREHPTLPSTFTPVAEALSDATVVRELLYRIQDHEERVENVAREFLRKRGLR
jgi:osmoprotectant transport system substrate-binding protein